MTDPIKAMIAAAKSLLGHGNYRNRYPERTQEPIAVVEFDRRCWDAFRESVIVAFAAEFDATVRAAEARPEPAAEPIEAGPYEGESLNEVLDDLNESLSHAEHVDTIEAFRGAITGCMYYMRDAVEALAREVRR